MGGIRTASGYPRQFTLLLFLALRSFHRLNGRTSRKSAEIDVDVRFTIYLESKVIVDLIEAA